MAAPHSRPPPAIRMTLAQYLTFDASSETKHELVDGQVFAMSGATSRHSKLTMNIGGELRNALRDRPCVVHGPDMRVGVTMGKKEHRFYPDVSIVCGKEQLEEGDRTLRNPIVIVEVLSPTTEFYDRFTKFERYKSIPSFREYVLVSQKAVRVDHVAMNDDGSWTTRTFGPGDTLTLASVKAQVAIDEVYRKVLDA